MATADQDPSAAGSRGARSRRARPTRWTIVLAVFLLVGLGVSLAGALAWRASVRGREAQAFQTAATGVSKTVQSSLRRDSDFVTTLRAVLSLRPSLSASGFREWFAALEGRGREVGGLGTLVVRAVPAAQLAPFQARRDSDPAFRDLMGAHVVPVRRSGRATYCLLAAGNVAPPYKPEVAELLQGDWCDPRSPIGSYSTGKVTQAQLMASTTDSGRLLVFPLSAEGTSTFFIEGAFYAGGATLRTAAARRAARLGWVSSSFEIPALMHVALGDARGLRVVLYHANPGHRLERMGGSGARGSGRFSYSAGLQLDGEWVTKVTGAVALGGLSANVQALLILVGGTIVSVLLALLALVLVRGRQRALVMVREKTVQLRHQALHDALTGLPNRVLALDRAEQMLARARREQSPVAALYIDLDGFKDVNDTFGHAAGDELLRIVASRLSSVVREGDTAARLGGDEFVVLVEGSTLDAGPVLVAERLLEVLSQPYEIRGAMGRRLSVTASIGIACALEGSAEELLGDADVALYEAKAAGRNTHVMFESGMHIAARDRLTLQMDLAAALEEGGLFLVYQPTFDLGSQETIGVEALLRWRHPTRGVLSPAEFMPIAEHSGLIVPIGRWVLREACTRAARWHAAGHRIGVSVNVSARQLDHDELIEDVRRALRESELDPGMLTLEITETVLMRDADAAARRLRALKALGVRLAIDDFGTGYSSLAYLRQFSVDALKIDRSFISGVAASEQSAALIHTLVQLGKTLDLDTLAEGIEDDEQLATLRREQCEQGQGFLFSRPLQADDVEAFLSGAAPRQPARSY